MPSLLQIMACRLMHTKPLSEPLLFYCWFEAWENFSAIGIIMRWISIQENDFEKNVVWKMVVILFLLQCVEQPWGNMTHNLKPTVLKWRASFQISVSIDMSLIKCTVLKALLISCGPVPRDVWHRFLHIGAVERSWPEDGLFNQNAVTESHLYFSYVLW